MIDWSDVRVEMNRLSALDLAKRMNEDPILDALIRAQVKSYPESVLQRDHVSRDEKRRLEAAIMVRDSNGNARAP